MHLVLSCFEILALQHSLVNSVVNQRLLQCINQLVKTKRSKKILQFIMAYGICISGQRF